MFKTIAKAVLRRIVGSNKKFEVFFCTIQGSTYLNNACLIIQCALTTKSKEAWMEVKRKQSSTRFRIHGQSQWNQYWYLCKWIRNNNTILYAQCFRIKKRIVPLPVSSYHYFVRFSAPTHSHVCRGCTNRCEEWINNTPNRKNAHLHQIPTSADQVIDLREYHLQAGSVPSAVLDCLKLKFHVLLIGCI